MLIHRAILGSLERFLAVLCEHTAGRWPPWLSPRQVLVCPVGQQHAEAAAHAHASLRAAGFHAELDAADATLGRRLRAARQLRFNYIAVVGDAEAAGGVISVRRGYDGAGTIDEGVIGVDAFVAALRCEVAIAK